MYSIDCDINFQWCWQSNEEPWAKDIIPEYTQYSPDINQLIELAFRNNKLEVKIDGNYKINFKNRIQINLNDSYKQRRVIRREIRQNNQRMVLSTKAVRSFGADIDFHGCQFIVDWHNLANNQKPAELVDAAIQGIFNEADIYFDRDKAMEDAQNFVDKLNQVKYSKLDLIQETCVKIYTEESFLYRLINQTLRDDDRSKLNNLGPFCYLLYNYVGSSNNENTKLPDKIVLYRGERLTPETIREYKLTAGNDAVWRWTQFISTSKRQEVAEKFSDGCSLFIIEMNKLSASDQGVCIAPLSRYKQEEEVLLRPGIRFKIKEAVEEQETKKQIFRIEILPTYMSGLHGLTSTFFK